MYSHAFQSINFPVCEFQNGSSRLNEYLQSLALQLNSNEEFEPGDEFDATCTFAIVRVPERGGGKTKYNNRNIGTRVVDSMLHDKRSVVTIKNTDDLCCARAIVTMIARHGRKSNQASKRQYDNMRKGYPIKKTRAEELHLLANEPLGPCGIEELKKFQAILPDYQIKVLSYDKPHCIIFKGTEDLEKKILLIKVYG